MSMTFHGTDRLALRPAIERVGEVGRGVDHAPFSRSGRVFTTLRDE